MNLAGTLGRLLLTNVPVGARDNSESSASAGETRGATAAPAMLLSRFSNGNQGSVRAFGLVDDSLADLLALALQKSGVDDAASSRAESDYSPSPAQTDEAALMIRAMLNAAKCDGRVDESEMSIIQNQIEDLGREELAFISYEIRKPVDLETFIRTVPRGMERSVYLMSLLAITIDTPAETRYLRELAKGLELSQEQVESLHAQVGRKPG